MTRRSDELQRTKYCDNESLSRARRWRSHRGTRRDSCPAPLCNDHVTAGRLGVQFCATGHGRRSVPPPTRTRQNPRSPRGPPARRPQCSPMPCVGRQAPERRTGKGGEEGGESEYEESGGGSLGDGTWERGGTSEVSQPVEQLRAQSPTRSGVRWRAHSGGGRARRARGRRRAQRRGGRARRAWGRPGDRYRRRRRCSQALRGGERLRGR